MEGSRTRSWREAGVAGLEYVGLIVLAGLLTAAIIGAVTPAKVGQATRTAVCSILDGASDGSCAVGPGQDGGQSWPCTVFHIGCDTDASSTTDIPKGLDPDSDIVKELLLTERGRATLQWLYDHDIPVVIDAGVQGAYWDGTTMVLGQGFDNPAVIVHETNHAKYTVEGRHADVHALDRTAYVKAAIDEEVDGTVQQIQAAIEFRAAGASLDPQPAERQYTAAYDAAIASGASEQDAVRAGTAAVDAQFYNGGIVTSTNGQSYPDYYGNDWDHHH